MSPLPITRRPEPSSTPAAQSGRPLLSFDFAWRPAPSSPEPRFSSLREAISRWLEQPL